MNQKVKDIKTLVNLRLFWAMLLGANTIVVLTDLIIGDWWSGLASSGIAIWAIYRMDYIAKEIERLENLE